MGQTPWMKLPYPEPTAPVKDGAINMRALAEGTEKGTPANSLATGSTSAGRGPQTGDRSRVVSFRGTVTSNQFGQVVVPLPAGTAGWAYADARPFSTVQNGGQIYLVLDSANSSTSSVIFYAYAQSSNGSMTNYAATFAAVIHTWEPIT